MRAGDQHDRTIAPTARRLSEARRAGASAHSREFVSAASAGAAVVAIILLSSQLWTATRDLLRAVWSAPLTRLSNGPVPEAAAAALLQIAGLVAVLLVVPLVAAVLANALQTGFRLNVRWPQLRFATVSPMAGLRRIRDSSGWFAIGLLAIKLAVTTGLVDRAIRTVGGTESAAELSDRIASVSLQLAAVLIGLSLVDWMHRRRQFHRGLRLTPSEARQEARDSKAKTRPRTRMPSPVSGLIAASAAAPREAGTLPTDPLFS